MLGIVASYHCIQFQRKIMNQTFKNGRKPSFGPDFGLVWAPRFFSWILPLLDVRHCSKISLYAISRKTIAPNLRKCQKKLVSGPILASLAQIRWTKFFFFFFFFFCKSLDIMVSYHQVKCQKKIMIRT